MTERTDLGTLVGSMRGWGRSVAVVERRGVRRFVTGYAELASLAMRFAGELNRRGIGPGDRVVLLGANSAEWMAAFFGCVVRGALVVPLDAAGPSGFPERVARETASRLVVGDREPVEQLNWSAPRLFLHELRELGDRAASPPPLGPDTPLQILFTSGTTGEPKGVVHTHRNLLASLRPIEREIEKYRKYERWVHPLRFLHTLPLSHVFGQFMGLWVPPLLGATVVYESRTAASRIAALIPEERVNVLAAVPRTLGLLRGHLLASDPELATELEAAQGLGIAKRWWRFRRVHRQLGLRFWAAVCGGATLGAELEQFWTGLGFALVQGYGLTETAALVTLNHPFRTARGSLGAPLPGRELRLSERGELEVKGEMVAAGSWQGGRIVSRDSSWLPTGDLARIEEGRVQFLGRTGQRLVTAAGLNVYLQDVEASLEAQPEIAGAVVFGAAGPEGGEEPAAVVAARGDAGAGVDRANRELAGHQRVGRWWAWPELELPRTATGKVRRAEVERWARKQLDASLQGGPAETLDAGEQDAAVRLLLQVGARRGPLEDEARLDEDWGLDSMGRVGLASALEERLGVGLSDGLASRMRTLGDLRAAVRGGGEPVARAQALLPTGPHPEVSQARGTRQPGRPERGGAVRHRYPTWPWSAPARWARFCFGELVARPLAAMLAAPEVRRTRAANGRGAGPAAWGSRAATPMLMIANHRTALDLPLILFALPPGARRRVTVAMSGEILAGWANSWNRRPLPAAMAEHRRWWGPPIGLLLRALFNVFPLPRTSGYRASFDHAGRALDRGFHVLIFPEGRRTPEGEPLQFRPGLGILARESFVPVLPIALGIPAGAERQWFRSRPVISIGEPRVVDAAASPERITEQLQGAVEELRRGLGKP